MAAVQGWGTRHRLYLISLAIQLAIAPFVVHDWDGFVFTRTVRDFLSGATPYAIAEADPHYIHLGNAWPPLNTWYAYPPLPLLLMTPSLAIAFASAAGPWLVRIALKLPFIVGTLALAWTGEKLLRSWGKPAGAVRWERLILLNPFLLFVSAAWGMFDAWMVALVLLSIFLIDRGRTRLAGIAFGASALMKLFPLFAAPALALYVARSARRRIDALWFALTAAATFAVVSLPFFVPHPKGFLLQVWRMHLERPPQGLSVAAIVVEATRLGAARGWLQGEPPIRTLGAVTLGITLGLSIATTAAAARARGSHALVRSLIGLFAGVLLTSKVLNEQYFVIPVALYALVFCASQAKWAFVGYRAFSIGALVASLVLGWHFLMFWPGDVAESLVSHRPNVIVGRIASVSGLGAATFAFMPTVVSFLALTPAFIAGIRRVARECKVGVRIITVLARRILRSAAPRPRAVAIVVLLAPVLIQIAAMAAEPSTITPRVDSAKRHVGAFYYLWWASPSHDPAILDGNWRDGLSEKPLDGYYTVSASKLRSDFRLARSNGVDLVVTSFHEYDLPLLPVALRAAADQDMAIAPLIELGEIAAKPQYRSPDEGFMLDERSADAIVDLASKALSPFENAPAAYRPGGKLAVFLYDSYFWGADWSGASKETVLDRVVTIADEHAKGEHTAAPPRADLEQAAPETFGAMLEDKRFGYLWRRAYAGLYRDFWQRIREKLEKRFGPLFIFSGESWNPGAPFHRGEQTALDGMRVFDASFMYSPSFVWVLHKQDGYERNWQRWAVRNVLQAQYSRGAGHPVVATVMPAYDDRVGRKKNGFEIPHEGPRGDTYDLTWQLALALSPDLVLVTTWNEFFEGTAIEPTVEHGDAWLKRTRDWSQRMSNGAPKKKRGLVLTGESSSHFTPGFVDPTVEGRHARNLQVVVERDLPDYSFDAVDVDLPGLEGKDFSRYRLIVVEHGLDVPRMVALAPRLTEWVKAGGHLLVSGVADAWPLARGREKKKPAALGMTHVTTRDGARLALAPASQPRAFDLEPDAAVLMRYDDGDGQDLPAAWYVHVGTGLAVATSFNVAGRDVYPGPDATPMVCACLRPLLDREDKCGNGLPGAVP